jgi:hypothetical protein
MSVPDMTEASLDPGPVPVGPVAAVEFARGYGAVPGSDVDSDDGLALDDADRSLTEALALPVYGRLVIEAPAAVPDPIVPLGPVAVELDNGNGAPEKPGVV